MYDVLIIGAGVSGSAIARELSRYVRKIGVLEKASDVCEGTSKANSGIVHAGFDAKPGTLKARLNVEGSRKMKALSGELDFHYKQNGSMVLCFDEAGVKELEHLLAQGEENGVEGLCILRGEKLRQMEPNLSPQVVAALHAPTGGIVCPFGLTIALAENAAVNGVEFFLNTEVTDIQKTEAGFVIQTNHGQYESKIVVNAAGVYADDIHHKVSGERMNIIPRKGEYFLLDKTVGNFVTHTIFQLPTKYGKGVLVSPTVHGNILLGPTATDIEDKEGVNTTAAGLDEIVKTAALSADHIPAGQVITTFAGLRAHEEKGDFIIKEAEDVPGWINAAGIESPGLTCAPALGEYVAQLVGRMIPAELKKDFIATRKGIAAMADADEGTRKELIGKNPAYANVICRCELVTEGEIMDAIHRPLGATTLDGVKRRTRAGMGRCQAGFCSPKVVEILARELGKDPGEITKSGEGSELLTGYNKGGIENER